MEVPYPVSHSNQLCCGGGGRPQNPTAVDRRFSSALDVSIVFNNDNCLEPVKNRQNSTGAGRNPQPAAS